MGSPIQHQRIRKTLARNVKAFLASLEISENALANKCQVSQKQINNITNARTGCGTDALVEMANVFGVEPWMLLLEELPKILPHYRRLQRLVNSYAAANDADQDLIEQVASRSTPSSAA